MPSLLSRTLEIWNRKLHFYAGLYLLFFLWLFSLTGLLLNHPQWKFAEFWAQRKETTHETRIDALSAASDTDRARELMRQLNLTGEIELPEGGQQPGQLSFNVSRPGSMDNVRADLNRRQASMQHIDVNAWGTMHVLHTFSGVRIANPQAKRDWALTTIWVIAMDAVAAGLLFLVFSSFYMWYQLKPKRRLGLIVLAAGVLSCALVLV